MLVKLEWLSYRTVKKLWHYVKPFSSDTGTSRTDRRTELLYQYRASVCWRAIKTRLTYVCVSVIRQVAAPCNALRYNITVANVRRYSPRGCCAFNALHCLWICYLSNKCIGDDTKGAARRSPNYIRKTKYVLWNVGICPVAEILWKNCFHTKNFTEVGQSIGCWVMAKKRPPSWVLIIWLSSSSKCAVVYQI